MNHLAVVLAGLMLWLFAASPADAARTEYFGISQGRELDSNDLKGMASFQVRTARFLIQWKSVQPSQGTLNWALPDRVVGSLARRGIRPVPFVWGSPGWVRPGPSRPPTDSAFARQAWRNFLRAAVARYGPGGTYWTTRYRQLYGANATPLPVQAWQVWNEPNLQKYFDPGGTSSHAVQKYAQLVQISHDAIKSVDSQARIVLAGMLGYGKPLAWDFLKGLYRVAGFKSNFDVAALHPYSTHLYQFRRQIVLIRETMANYGDSATPLWLTEFGWGSAPPDRFGINQGLAGQSQRLTDSFRMLLNNRRAWNLQRLYWFLWRDPPASGGSGCSFCGSAGLLKYNRVKKPSYFAFRGFVAEKVPPEASITGGPAQGSFTNDTTPSFNMASSEAGSTFVCRVDSGPFKACSPPFTTAPLSNGTHFLFVRAIDAPGNESQIVWRSFTVDTQAPPTPQITDTDPNSPANDNTPEVKGSSAGSTTVKLFKTASCAGGTAVAQGSASRFASPGITVSVSNDTTTALRARATDAAGNVSPCSGAFTYVEDSTP